MFFFLHDLSAFPLCGEDCEREGKMEGGRVGGREKERGWRGRESFKQWPHTHSDAPAEETEKSTHTSSIREMLTPDRSSAMATLHTLPSSINYKLYIPEPGHTHISDRYPGHPSFL